MPIPAQAADTARPAPDKVTIDVATVNGSGCRAGTAAVNVNSANTAFTVTYSDYLARAGGDSDTIDMRKNCQINLEVHIPQGFTYAIAKADYRGFAHLYPGAKAVQKAGYYFTGSSTTVRSSHDIAAPTSDNWQYTDVAEGGEVVYKPCGVDRNFNINSELRVYAGTDKSKTSFVAMDSTDGSVNTVFHFAWKQCP
ncbi:MAG: DUF4360 domain-containing protein [Stackebrandtia sp.]